ncbi:MAG: competence/damage-inducible protein A [Bacteroidota bacterium]|nr:competence/damage-inducible protein A [Bacteroidota bacterium]
MNAEILSIGDELLIGQVVNTNASWLGEQLSQLGITVHRVTVIGDAHADVLAAFRRAWDEHDLVIVTGGLGPTHDDVTRDAVCDFFDTKLVQDADVLADVEKMLTERRRPITDVNRDQAMVPAAARIMRNSEGTAPGYHFTAGDKHFFVAPGVPYEMQGMYERHMLPVLRAGFRNTRLSTTLLTTGIPESTLSDSLEGIDTLREDVAVAFLPSPTGVRIRLTAHAAGEDEARAALAQLVSFVEERAAEYLFGTGRQTLEEVVGALLAEHDKTLAVAESCTGGVITDKITNVPGSSSWFERGVISYSNASKVELLGVDDALIRAHGAVSGEVARAMADGARRSAGVDIGLATTGIAGPSGGSPHKPVGLVWIAVSTARETLAHAYYFGEHRVRTKQRAAQAALDMVRRQLCSLPPIPSILTETS